MLYYNYPSQNLANPILPIRTSELYDDPRRSKACSRTESTAIRIDFTPCRGVPFYPHDTGTMRLMQPIKLHKGVPVTTLPKCALTNCQAPVNAETPRVHSRIPPGQPQIIHLKQNIT